MFDRRSLTLGAAWLVATACQLDAQGRHVSADSLLRVVIARDSVLAHRARVVDSLRRALASAVPNVDVTRGPLRVRTLPELQPRVRHALDSVAALIDRRGGLAIASRVARRVPAIGRDSARAVVGYSHLITIAADTVRRWSGAGRRRVRYDADLRELTAALAELVEEIAVEGVDSTLSAWLMVGRVPVAPSAREAGDTYTEFATTESAALRRCRGGDDASCLDVLGIDSAGQSRLARWYGPGDYRALLGGVAPPNTDSAAVVSWLRCREDRDHDACRAAAHALPNDRVPFPLSATARFMFLREVLDAGGAGAYDRLLASSGTLSVRFAAASGEPLERTVRRWVTRVEGARPDRMRISPALALASLGWAGAFLAITFTRRDPWT